MICMLLCTLFLGEANAQKKSVGSSFSYAGIGFVYDHTVDENSFTSFQMRLETANRYDKRSNGIGFTTSLSWNMIFSEKESPEGNTIKFYAGPGLIAGVAGDIKRKSGMVFGMKGVIGGECTFKRKVCISMDVSPVIGVHLARRDGMWNMLLYKTGLMYAIMPEIGIKYAF